MAQAIVVGSDVVSVPWIRALRDAGYEAEHCAGVLAFQDHFARAPADILVIDIANADHGEAMLMVQARAVWPDCRVIALPRDRSYRSSALFSMGLWAPDCLMLQPVEPEVLVRTVRQLCIQARVDRIVRERRENRERQARRSSGEDAVILHCDEQTPARWAVRTH